MLEREIPDGVSKTVMCPVCGKPMTWKLSNVTDQYAWHCRNIDCSEYNPEQVDKEPAVKIKPISNTIEENCIQIFTEGGVIQDITGIPKGEKVIIVDWDTEGVDSEDLTQLEAGQAIVSIWEGN